MTKRVTTDKPHQQTTPLKIGYLIPQFPGQTHIFFWRECDALGDMNVTTKLFSTRPPPPGLIAHDWSDQAIALTEYLGKIRPLRALATLLRIPPRVWLKDVRREGATLLKDLLICAAAADQLAQSCKTAGISHVHVHSCGRAALIATLAHHLTGLTYSITLHGPMSDYGVGQRLKWRHAAFATVITRKLRALLPDQLGPDLPDRIIVQPMGVDVDALNRETPYIPAQPDTPIRLFSCGRLNVVKGHQDLMQAVRLLRDRGFDATLEIAGEDDDGGDGYHAELQRHCDALNLQNHVTLLGAVSAETVKQKLLTAHIFALASWHEPLGVAYMEAMACGVPTIATNSGGVPELITDGENGLMVPPKDPAALADAIERIARDSDLAHHLSTTGRDYVVANCASRLGAETLKREVQRLGHPE